MRALLFSASVAYAALASGALAQSAQTHSVEALTEQCVRETRASGAYAISYEAVIPQVSAGAGGSARGARDVNDCLADKFQVQPGVVVAVAPNARGEEPLPLNRQRCAQIFSRSPGQAALASFGSSVLFGAVGASIQASVYQRNLQSCLALYGRPGGARSTLSECNSDGQVMVRGARYCSG